MGGGAKRAGIGAADPIVVGDGSWIGARAVILGGATIGSGCIIGAGAVVLPGIYEANTLLAGVPARVIKKLPEGPHD
jgi:acetyltransferase-like isoleucine patch superfamily enzyme